MFLNYISGDNDPCTNKRTSIFAYFDMPTTTFKYFAISDLEIRWGLYVLNVGTSLIPPNAEFPPRNHPAHHYFRWRTGRILQEFQLFYLIDGQGLFECPLTGEMKLQAGQAVLLFPGIWHRYKPLPGSPWHTYWIGFNGQFAHHIVEQGFFKPEQPVLTVGYQESLVKDFLEIQRIGQEEWAGYQQVLAGSLLRLLGTLYATCLRRPFFESGYEELMQRAKIMLVESLENPLPVESIANQLGISYSLFRKLFRQYTGLAPGQYAIQLRIENAKNQLLRTNKSIKEIAYQLGFESIYYFTRIFKEKTGCPPGEFRKLYC